MEESKDFQTHRGFRGCKLFHGGTQWKFEFDNGYGACERRTQKIGGVHE